MDAPQGFLVSSLNNIQLSPPGSPPQERGHLAGRTATWAQSNSSYLTKLWKHIYVPVSPFVSPPREKFDDEDSEKINEPVKMKSLISMTADELREYQKTIKHYYFLFQNNSQLKGHEKAFADRLLEIYIVSDCRAAFHKHAQSLKPEHIDDDALSRILDHFDKKLKEVQFLKKEYANFIYSYRKAETLSLKLHDRFAFLYPHSPAIINPLNNKTTLTYEQLKVAVKMAQDHFPQLLDGMWHDHFVPMVTRLIQIIVAGQSAQSIPMPDSATIFALKELEGKETFPKLREVAPNRCFLFHHYNNFENAVDTHTVAEFKKEEAAKRLEKIVTQFTNDTIIRTGNCLKINGKTLLLGGNPEGISPFALLKDAFTDFLRDSSVEQIQAIIDEVKKSPLLETVKKVYGKDWLPLLLQEEIESLLKGSNNAYCRFLEGLCTHSVIDPFDYADLVNKMGGFVQLNDIEELLHYYCLAFMLIANQNTQGEQNNHFYQQIIAISPFLNPLMTDDRTFELTGNPSGPFNSKGIMVARMLQEFYSSEGQHPESFQNVIPIFQSETLFSVPSLTRLTRDRIEDTPSTITLRNLQFHWKAPRGIIENVFATLRIKPHASLTQEPNLGPLMEQLSTISEQKEGDTLLVLRDSSIQINRASEHLSLSQRVSGNPYTMLAVYSAEAKQNAIGLLSEQMESAVRDYVIYHSLNDGNNSDLEARLAEIVKVVMTAQAGLIHMGVAPESIERFSRLIKQLA